jgi:hypothetical protein
MTISKPVFVPPRSIGTAATLRQRERLQFPWQVAEEDQPGLSRRDPPPDTFLGNEHKQEPRYAPENAGHPSGSLESGCPRNTDAPLCSRRVCNRNKNKCNRNSQGRDAAERANSD